MGTETEQFGFFEPQFNDTFDDRVVVVFVSVICA
jgi:hypothetical protein